MTDKASRVGTRWVWYPGWVKSSVSIVLFFLLSGLFLTVLLGALEHSRKLLGVAAGCLAAVVLIIVFLTPVELPSWRLGLGKGDDETTTTTQVVSSTTRPEVTSTTGRTGVSSSQWRGPTSTITSPSGTTTITLHGPIHRTVTTEVSGG